MTLLRGGYENILISMGLFYTGIFSHSHWNILFAVTLVSFVHCIAMKACKFDAIKYLCFPFENAVITNIKTTRIMMLIYAVT